MIKTLDIERYRCFASARLPDCRRVNIIVGDNGSGKTSLLEAIMLVAGPSPAISFRLRQWRGFEGGQLRGSQRDIEDALWADLFHNFDHSKVVSIAARGDVVHTRRLTISYTKRDLYIDLPEKSNIVIPTKAPVTFRWNVSHRNPIEVTPRVEEGVVKMGTTPEPPTETFFFAANHTYSSVEAADRFSKLSKKSISDGIVAQFREHFPAVESLSVELFGGTPMIYCKHSAFKEKVPLNIVSSGMTKLAAILLSFPTAPGCIVLIDEIENGFYFRRNPEIWSTLRDFCDQYGAQIFATTHSGESLAAAAVVAERHPEDFTVIQVGRGALQQFNGDQFAEACTREHRNQMTGFVAKTYERPYFLLCEGEGDKRFFDQTLKYLNMESLFHVEFPDRRGDLTGGRSKFGATLATRITTSPSFRKNVRAILIVSDSDLDPRRSWKEVMIELEKSGGFPTPTREKELAKKTGFPHVVVLMLPIGNPGNLEAMCLLAAYDKWSLKTAVEDYTAATPAKDWDIGKKSKMQLQVILAATCVARPEAGFVGHWREKSEYHIPIDHACFEQVRDFLAQFPTLVDAA